MPSSPALARIQLAEREVRRFREDVEDWSRTIEEMAQSGSVGADLVAKANYLLGRILDLDSSFREHVFRKSFDYSPEVESRLEDVLKQWLDLAIHVDPSGQLSEAGQAVEELRSNIQDVRDMLTPDDEFFQGEGLASLRDDAIRAHRAGETEALLDDEHSA